MMKKIILTVALLCAAPLTFAQASSLPAIEKLFEVMQIEQHSQQTLNQLKPQLQQQAQIAVQYRLKKQELNLAEQTVALELAEQMYQSSLKHMSWSSLKPVYIRAYQDTFTDPEIQAQIDFYQSPIGQSILKKSPNLAVRMTQLTNERLTDLIQQASQDFGPIEKKLQQLEQKSP